MIELITASFLSVQCLLPLLDVPLLAWTLECLATSGVEQVFIFVNNGIEEVRAWLSYVLALSCLARSVSPSAADPLGLAHRTSIYSQPHYPLSIIFRPTTAQTPGDILREVDSLQILNPADFLVVQVGYVGNVDLKQRVEEFGERRKMDQALAMSCVVAPRGDPSV